MEKSIPAGARVALLGDSYTHNGLWHQEALHLLNRADGAKQIKLFNCGIGGDTMHTARERLDCDVARYKPTHVFVLFGANDCHSGTYSRTDRAAFDAAVADRPQVYARYEEALRGMIADIRAHGWVPIIGTPTRFPLSETHTVDTSAANVVIDHFAELCRTITAEEQVLCLDLNRCVAQVYDQWQGDAEHELYVEDHVHPTPMGYRLLGRAWLAELGYEVDLPNSKAGMEAAAQTYDFDETERTRIAGLQRACVFISYALWYGRQQRNLPDEDLVAYVLEWLENPDTGDMWKRNIRSWITWRHRLPELLQREEEIATKLAEHAAKNR